MVFFYKKCLFFTKIRIDNFKYTLSIASDCVQSTDSEHSNTICEFSDDDDEEEDVVLPAEVFPTERSRCIKGKCMDLAISLKIKREKSGITTGELDLIQESSCHTKI